MIVLKACGIVLSERVCKKYDTFNVADRCPPILNTPNAFTPNDDGKNDTNIPTGLYITAFSMKIYNRWGALLCVTKDLNSGWDGNYNNILSAPRRYMYIISYEGYTKFKKTCI